MFKKWNVYADLTPFSDRWGKEHTRRIGRTWTKTGARVLSEIFLTLHPHGSTQITRIDLGYIDARRAIDW